MASVSALFRAAWRSGLHVGANRPTQVVRIRRGEFRRAYAPWSGDDVQATIPRTDDANPWQATWTPLDAWRELPNVVEVNLEQDFDNNGVTSGTVQIDNVVYAEDVGVAGTFHRILRGFLAPLRGYRDPFTPNRAPAMASNEWFRYLNSACQIEVWQGYGDERVRTFTGLIETLDLRSLPDQVTISARDFGQACTDQHLLGYCKDPHGSRKPTVFADRRAAENTHREGTAGPGDASSSLAGNPARYVADAANDTTAWISANQLSPNHTEYVQIRVPAGRYESIYLHPGYDGMECYVSVFARSKNVRTPSHACRVDGVDVADGWLDLAAGDLVPSGLTGSNGGHHYVKRYPNVGHAGHYRPFGHVLELGDDSVIRVSFQSLREVRNDGRVVFRAAVRRLIAIRREVKKEAAKNAWILVDDYSDVVKVVLRWAGFKEWDVESTGVGLVGASGEDNKLTFHNGDTLIDVIKKVQEITNYCFFMGDPSGSNDSDASIGVPVFRTPNVIGLNNAVVEQVRDTDLLTGMAVKWANVTLPEIIYVRGKPTPSGVHGSRGPGRPAVVGVPLAEDDTRRYQASYRPPWTKRDATGGVIRHFVKTYNNLQSAKECLVAARYIALNGALQSLTGIIEIPGNPGIGLDDVIGVVDTGTGTNTRLYVASRSSVFRAGEETSWKMTLGGSLIDSPDVQEIAADVYAALLSGEVGAIAIGSAVNASSAVAGRPQRPSRTRSTR
jgi:hypothetical protein